MKLKTIEVKGLKIAVVNSEEKLITDVSSALDFIMSVQYETQSNRIALHKKALPEDFFILRTGLAGEVLQKFINYRIKFAVIGDFSSYTSKPLKDFMYESNHGKDFFFVPSEEEAIRKLSSQ